MTALLLLALQAVDVAVGGESFTLDGLSVVRTQDALVLSTPTERPGLSLMLVRRNGAYVVDTTKPHSLWWTPDRGGPFTTITAAVEDDDGRLTGTFGGSVQEPGRRGLTGVRGTFYIARAGGHAAVPVAQGPSELGCCLVWFSLVFLACSHVWFLAVAWRVHPAWGLAVLFVPVTALIFTFMNWEEAKRPFIAQLTCTGAVAVTFVLVAVLRMV